jgi:DNA repair ATPase RecN
MLSANMQRWIIPKVIALLSSFVLFTPLALADTTCLGTRTAAQPQMAEQLDSFERGAALTRDQIDHYAAAVRNGNPHRDSHAVNLNLARQNVNRLGIQMSEMEKVSPQGTPLQQATIREARPHLELLANDVQTAIVLLKEGASGYRSADFRKAVNGMYKQADLVYSKVDSLTDFEKACNRAVDVIAVDMTGI